MGHQVQSRQERCLYIRWEEPINWKCAISLSTVTVVNLGCQFKCYMCEIDTQPFICKFYGAFYNILRVIGSKRNEIVAVHLIKSYCLPSLLYSCETWHARSDDIRSANVALNNSSRKEGVQFFLTILLHMPL